MRVSLIQDRCDFLAWGGTERHSIMGRKDDIVVDDPPSDRGLSLCTSLAPMYLLDGSAHGHCPACNLIDR
jgi:hypothetical protein